MRAGQGATQRAPRKTQCEQDAFAHARPRQRTRATPFRPHTPLVHASVDDFLCSWAPADGT